MIYKSKPQEVEALQWTGENRTEVLNFLLGKGSYQAGGIPALLLLAGADGAQGWVNVPVGHWLVHKPNDKSDIWPVAPDYFAEKYENKVLLLPPCPICGAEIQGIDSSTNDYAPWPSFERGTGHTLQRNLFLAPCGHQVDIEVRSEGRIVFIFPAKTETWETDPEG